jgi:hypothetical protein
MMSVGVSVPVAARLTCRSARRGKGQEIPMRKALAVLVAVALVVGATLVPVAAQPPGQASGAQPQGQIAGTAKNEAKRPYANYEVRARLVGTTGLASTVQPDQNAGFALNRLALGSYVVELFDVRQSKVVCTEGPFDLTRAMPSKTDVNISCNRVPAAWLLLSAAGAAGLAAGVAIGGTCSPSK